MIHYCLILLMQEIEINRVDGHTTNIRGKSEMKLILIKNKFPFIIRARLNV